jgi:hypothetical protein
MSLWHSNLFELHEAILKAHEFDSKHKATFSQYDHWQRGREISLMYMKRITKLRRVDEGYHCWQEIKIPGQSLFTIDQ